MTSKKLQLRLYVAGKSPNSVQALQNLEAICNAHFSDKCVIEVIDLYEHPSRAIEDSVMLTPTMIVGGSPSISVVGNLSDTSNIIDLLKSAAYDNAD